MKINDMYSATLLIVLVAILIGVSLTMLANFSTQVRQEATQIDDTVYLWTINYTPDLTQDYITTGTGITVENANGTSTFSSACLTWDKTGTFAGDSIKLTTSPACNELNGTDVNVSYTYGASTNAQTNIDTSLSSIGNFVTWFSIIIVVIAAGIIIGIVIRSFSGRG